MFRFHFELYPLGEVSPWGSDQTKLHWLGLTEGWYWIGISGHELLHRTRVDHPYPYVDYYLARLWEDVNVLTPSVLEPVHRQRGRPTHRPNRSLPQRRAHARP